MPSEHLLKILSYCSFAIYLALQAYAIINWRGGVGWRFPRWPFFYGDVFMVSG